MSRLWSLTALAVLCAVPELAMAGEPVLLDLPVRSKIDTDRYRSIAVAPFSVHTEEGSRRSPTDLSVELERYVRRTLERSSGLRVRLASVQLPTHDPETLVTAEHFWRAVAESTGSDLVLGGAVDFDFEDRSGYVTREFVSDRDGRTYFAQVLVEEEGIELDLLLWVFDGQTGRLLHGENFRDFKSSRGASRDPMVQLFSDLEGLTARLVGLFAARTVPARRVLQ